VGDLAGKLVTAIERLLYTRRGQRLCIAFLLLTSLLMAWQALLLKPDAGFDKTVPLQHPYMQVLQRHQGELGSGGNAILVALMQPQGTIYNERFFESLRTATTEVEFIPGIDRTRLSSIFTRNVRYLEVVDGGFEAEDVVPADYAPSPEMLDGIRVAVGKAGVIGRLVSENERGALVYAEVLERNPSTNERTDYARVAAGLEDDVRGRLTKPYKYLLRLDRDHDGLKAGQVVAERFAPPSWTLWFETLTVPLPEQDGQSRNARVPGRWLGVDRIPNPQYNPQLSVHIVGFAKMVGDIGAATREVVFFFGLTVLGSLVALWIYLRDLRLAWLPLACSVLAVIWELGLLRLAGHGLDPFAILVPFLVLAISTSHGVQYVNTWADRVVQGDDSLEASRLTFRRLFIPGSIALITNVAGFATIALVPIGVIREMALNACLGMLAVIVTNKLLMPIWLSRLRMADLTRFRARRAQLARSGERLWQFMARVTDTPVAIVLIVLAALVLGVSLHLQQGRIVGDAQQGVPELRPDSVYNGDSRLIAENFAIATDVLTVVAEADAWDCIEASPLEQVDRFAWHMRNLPEVHSTRALPDLVRGIHSGFLEAHVKYRVLPRNADMLVLTTKPIDTTTGLLNKDCSAMPVLLFTRDHRAATIRRITAAVENFNRRNSAEFFDQNPGFDESACAGRERREEIEAQPGPSVCPVHFALAAGNVGVMAATNEVVERSEWKLIASVYAVVGLLILLSYRSLGGLLVIAIPLFLVSVFADALMSLFGIGLKLATLPVVTLAVGIGVDYGIYVYDLLRHQMRDEGLPLREAYVATLRQSGKAVIFTGLCLAGGVVTWLFSGLQFQRDMGLLLIFMFSANMLGAVLLGPALCRFLLPARSLNTRGM